MVNAAALEFHPFLAERFAEAVVPASMILVVDHDPRPLERLLESVKNTDAKWLDAQATRAKIHAAAEAVANLPRGEPPEELISVHHVGKDAHTGRDIILDSPEWARALNAVARALCVATGRARGWNPQLLATTDDGETLDQFVAGARALHPEALSWYSKLAAGMLAWMQGGELRGYLSLAEVGKFREALQADERQMFLWKDKGGDFHRRKLQAFCFLAQKHRLGLAAVASP
jgi:uncharacterized protein (DUF2249 family)